MVPPETASEPGMQQPSLGHSLTHHDFWPPVILYEQLSGPHYMIATGDNIFAGQSNEPKNKSRQM